MEKALSKSSETGGLGLVDTDEESDLQFEVGELLKEAEGYIEMVERERLLETVKKKAAKNTSYMYLVNRFESLKSEFRTNDLIKNFIARDTHSVRFLRRVRSWITGRDRLPLLRSTYETMRDLLISDVPGQLNTKLKIPTKGTLLEKLKSILEQAADPENDITGIPLTYLRPIITSASDEERDAAGADKDLLDKLSTQVNNKDIPRLMWLLNVRQESSEDVDDPHGDITDMSIRSDIEIMREFGELIRDVSMRGVEVLGRVVVLQGDDWVRTMKTFHPGESSSDLKKINAETTGGIIYLNADRGDEGTLIHESIHQYAPDDFAAAFGNELNEGATEYFARKITTRLNIPRAVYESNIALITPIIQRLGEGVIARAYFQADIGGVKSLFLGHRLSAHGDREKAVKEWDRLHDVLTLGMEYTSEDRQTALREYGLIP